LLIQITIKNFAVFDDISVDLKKGMSVITGESGSGKSVLVNAISLIKGTRAYKEIIRNNCEYALVEAVFELSESQKKQIKHIITDMEIDDTLIITRKIKMNQNSECRLNGRIRSLAVLTEVSACLIDIHGQYENQSLLKQEKHIEYLDLFADIDIKEDKELYIALLKEYNETIKLVTQNSGSNSERERDKQIYEFQIDDIIKSQILEFDWEQKYNAKKLMDNLEKVEFRLANCLKLLDDEQISVLDNVYESAKNLEHIEEIGDVKNIKNSILEAYYILSDNVKNINNIISNLEFEEEQLETINDVINDIEKAKSKYGKTKEEIEAYLNHLNSKLEYINNFEILQKKNIEKIINFEQKIGLIANRLSSKRKDNAVILEQKIEVQLNQLHMKNVEFKIKFIEITEKNTLGYKKFFENGNDFVEFYISTIKGHDLMPLIRIASGGEMARIMLALKGILADKDNINTLIFDEIDSGISGETSKVAGIKLFELSKNKQVICITHLPQIVAKGNHHYIIEKQVKDDITIAKIIYLDSLEKRINQLAKLIDGDNVTKEGLLHAKEILK